MGKKNKEQDITTTLDKYDEDTLERYNDGIRDGMALCNHLFYDQVSRLKQSLDDIMCLYMEEDGEYTKSERIMRLQTTYDALTLLSDRFQDAYFAKFDSLKEPEVLNWKELRDSLQLD